MMLGGIDIALRTLVAELLEPLVRELHELKAAISRLSDDHRPHSDYISIPEAARLVAADPRALRGWIDKGNLRAYGTEGVRRVRLDELHKFMASGSPDGSSDVIDLKERARQVLTGSPKNR